MKNLFYRAVCLSSLFCLSVFGVSAQEIGIEDGGIYVGCGATIVDTGGNAAEYSNDENVTFTVCPGAPDTIVTIEFIIFSLGEGDIMNIYQGVGTAGPLVGSFSGSELSGQAFSTADGNPTYCITVEFISDAEDTGNFAFLVSCGPPCDRPVAIVETEEPQPVLVCVGEEVTFDGTSSEFGEGAALESYEWDFDDGTTDTTSGLVVSHSFDEPGGYIVQLYLTDDNECNSINLPDVQVLVSTTPSFLDTPDSINMCLGQSGNIDIIGSVEGTTWVDQPENPIGGYLEIPDDQSQCFSSEIIFSNFEPGATVTDASDIESVFVNMEHSYMGDLLISLICPDGSQLDMHEQGGGSTFLGVPNDPDIGMEIQPGEGFDYYWAPDATNGTWVDESNGVSPLPSGTYSSVQPFDNLIGCPLNGVWTLQICDLFGADNGVVFDWTVAFDPSLYPESTTFTPTFGQDCDSTYWSGPNISGTSEDCNGITIAPTGLGTFEYTYVVVDNHGCTYEHITSVEVEQGPLAEVENEELSFCGDPVQLGAFVSNSEPGANYIFEWSPSQGLSNPNSPDPVILNMSQSQTYTVFVYEAGLEVCGSEATVNVELIPPVFSETEIAICEGDEYVLPGGSVVANPGVYVDTLQSALSGCDSVVTTSLQVNPIYDLTTEIGICGDDVVTLPDGTVVTTPGEYEVTLITETGCDSTITTIVTGVSVDAGDYETICPPEYPFDFLLEGTVVPMDPEATVTWSGPSELDFTSENSLTTPVNATEGGTYTITLTDSRCPESPDSTTFILKTNPEIGFPNNLTLCLGETYELDPVLTGDFLPPPFVWGDSLFIHQNEIGDTLLIDSEDYLNFLNVPNLITLVVPAETPCFPAQASLFVEVIDCEVVVPNIFTPNGDGLNDVFEITGIENFPNSRLIILNRWGKVVYESDSYGVPFWNGTHYKSGAELADGVYYYELIISRLDEARTGTVNITKD